MHWAWGAWKPLYRCHTLTLKKATEMSAETLEHILRGVLPSADVTNTVLLSATNCMIRTLQLSGPRVQV
jgi:hypothetical protein